ncbi:MAG: rod shape-determining protein MreD [Bacteroidota bacterium]
MAQSLSRFSSTSPDFVRYLTVGTGVFLLQWLVLGRLQIFGAFPDVLILFVSWVALQQGRFGGTLAGFVAGFCLDLVYETYGIYMFAKTLLGFLVGIAATSERETVLIQPRQAFISGLMVALLHNGLTVALFAVQSSGNPMYLGLVLWIGSALYTAFLGLLAALFATR